MKVERIGGVIVAAGQSIRLGRPKAMLEIEGRPILYRLLDVYVRAGLFTVAVVSSMFRMDVPKGVVRVDADGGEMIDSVARGIDALPDDTIGAIIQPVDAPFTSSAMLERLSDDASDRPRVLTYDGQPGHPVYVPASRFGQIRERPDGGLRTIVFDGMESIEWNTLEILADIDNESDVERWLSR